MAGGFAPRLKTESLGVDGEVAFLASEHYIVKRAGVTLAGDGVVADADGNKIIPLGTLVTPRTSDGKYVPYSGATDEVQTVTITGAPTGGTFTLTFDGQTTDPLDFDVTGPEMKAALEDLSNVGVDDVSVSKASNVYTVTFGGALEDTNVPAMTADGSGLTGGTTPDVTIGTTTAGGAAGTPTLDPDVSGYVLESYNVKDGDEIGGIVIHGSVLSARVNPAPDATTRSALTGRIIFQ